MTDTFLKYLKYEKRYSKHTINSYETDLSKFQQYIKEFDPENDIIHADHLLIRAWIVSLIENDISPRSVNRKISTLRSFYKFLIKRELIDTNPVLKLKVLKTKKQLPSFVNESDISQMLDLELFSDDFDGWRDRLILELLYGTGIRLAELMNIKHADINLYENHVRVLGKRNKERIIPFSNKLRSVIENYNCKKNDLFGSNESDYLIVTNKGEQSYPMIIYRTVKKYLTKYTTLEKKSPHVMRHTFATHLLDKGADLNAVKDLLGHSSLAATQIYTHNSLEKLKSVFNQAHPKA